MTDEQYDEVVKLSREIVALTAENAALRTELSALRLSLKQALSLLRSAPTSLHPPFYVMDDWIAERDEFFNQIAEVK